MKVLIGRVFRPREHDPLHVSPYHRSTPTLPPLYPRSVSRGTRSEPLASISIEHVLRPLVRVAIDIARL